MSILNVRRLPRLPDDAVTYATMDAQHRLKVRVALAEERRLDLPTGIASIAILLATIPAIGVLWSLEPQRPTMVGVIWLAALAALLVLFAFVALVLSWLDTDRRRRAWTVVFDAVDSKHPAPLYAPHPRSEDRQSIWFTLFARIRRERDHSRMQESPDAM